jgi:hypothetical protein
MTRYQARWDHSAFEANVLRMFARTIQSIGLPRTASRNDLPETGEASEGAFAGGNSHSGTDRSPGAQPNAYADLQPMPNSLLNPPPEAANASQDLLSVAPAGERPPADRIEPVLTSPDDFSDLIALANGDDDDPLQPLREPYPPEHSGHDGMARFLAADIDESDPLAALTLEYRDALLSQKSGNAREPMVTAEDRGEPVIKAPQDPFAELVDPSHVESSVFDLLTKGKNIDTLLESLDPFGAEQIFSADETHEILALLAPNGIAAHRASQTAQLTREEHHMVSMDSHMAMPDSNEYEEPEFPDENNR